MVETGLGRVKTSGYADFMGSVREAGVGAGYALIAAFSGRTPMMLITRVML